MSADNREFTLLDRHVAALVSYPLFHREGPGNHCMCMHQSYHENLVSKIRLGTRLEPALTAFSFPEKARLKWALVLYSDISRLQHVFMVQLAHSHAVIARPKERALIRG